MSPRLNKKNSPGASKKFNSIILNQDSNYYTVDLFVWKPLIDSTGAADQNGGVTVTEFQNVLNTLVRGDVSTSFKVPIVSNDRIPTDNGTVKVKLLGAGEKPLESQIKGDNTLSWLETIETIEVEFLGGYNPSHLLDIFSLEDARDNIVTDSLGNKKTLTKMFFPSSVEPIIDNLRSESIVTGTKVTLTSGLTSLLQNPESGGLLEVDFIVEPVKPSNANYAVITYSSYMLHHALSIVDSNGIPQSINRVSELNKEDYNGSLIANKDYLVSDDWIIDGVYPKTITQSKVSAHSWMAGEIYNKLRVYDSMWVDQDITGNARPAGDNGGIEIAREDGYLSTKFGTGCSSAMPNKEYGCFWTNSNGSAFSDEILDLLKFNNERNGIKSWYNEFSFFENVFSEVAGGLEDNTAWNSSNSFFIFDVTYANAFGQGVETLYLSNPRKSLLNPNLSEETYDNFVNFAITGEVTINGNTFNTWDNPWEQISKNDTDNLYDWDNTENNRKYIVTTPGNNYVDRMNKIIEGGGKQSGDNSTNVKVSKTQIASARHPFPTGDGSKSFIYPNDIFFSEAYCVNEGWSTNNKLVVKLAGEMSIQTVTIDHWGGEKIKIEFFDSKGNPAVGIDQDGNETILPPTTIKAANQDASGNPLKTTSTVVFGFTIN